MKIHRREPKVEAAISILNECLWEISEGLTEGEYIRVVSEALCGVIGSVAKYKIREERHPGDPDGRGGLE